MTDFEQIYADNLDRFDVFIEQLYTDADDNNDALVGALELFADRLCETIDAVNEEADGPF